MSSGQSRADPLLAFRFAVEIDGIEAAQFLECSGLRAETEVFEYKEGGLNSRSHKLPVRTKFSNLTLKQGLSESRELVDWFQQLVDRGWSAEDRRDLSIVVHDPEGKEVLRWNLTRAIPVKWDGPSFKPDSNAVGIETLELAFDEISAVTG
ncbi:MAG: phage tail protein [Dehalococcoidia bacterium]